MQKPADTDSPVHEFARQRWSPRAFAPTPVSAETLRSLFEAARWSPSSNNEQPWVFLVATKEDTENFEKVIATFVPGNANWARNAPVAGIAVSKLAFAKTGEPNRNAYYDTGQAMAWLTMEATARGLFVHQMAGYDGAKAREIFGIPPGWDPIAAFAIGYPGEPSSLPQRLQDREVAPRTRKPAREFVMTGHWGQTAPFFSE
jgi:nitroreductase